jgi:hypothetical protein
MKREILWPLLLAPMMAAGWGKNGIPSEGTAGDERMSFVQSMFTGVERYESIHRLAESFPYHVIRASSSPFSFSRGEPIELPHTFLHHGQPRDTQTFLEETDTVSLVADSDGAIVNGRYWLTGGPDTHWPSWSVGKSFVSALADIAVSGPHQRRYLQPDCHRAPIDSVCQGYQLFRTATCSLTLTFGNSPSPPTVSAPMNRYPTATVKIRFANG